MSSEVSPLIERSIEEQRQNAEEVEPFARVYLHNDDITPYNFVVSVLERFFPLDTIEAERVTWTAHNFGQALVAILPVNDAQRRVGKAQFAAALEGYPLKFSIEHE